MKPAIANAPVSYGAFELTLGAYEHAPTAERVLREVSEAGYRGIDLGPLGYLGDRVSLPGVLAAHGLELAGAYLQLPLSEPDVLEGALGELDTLLGILDAVVEAGDRTMRPKPTLADAGSPAREARVGRAHEHGSESLDDEGWRRLLDGLARATENCRRAGFEPTFHHHAGTFVEAPWEIERVLEGSDMGLCLDTGHLLVGGADPVRALDDWGQRINHVHLKDVRRSVVDQVIADGADLMEVWRRAAFCRFGAGDLDVSGVLSRLDALDYGGWLVVEQDRFPMSSAEVDELVADQRHNREYLHRLGL